MNNPIGVLKLGFAVNGVTVIPSTATVASLLTTHKVTPEVKALRTALRRSTDGDSWVATYMKLHSPSAENYAKTQEFKFDDIIHWFKSFHVIKPMDPTTPYYKHLLYRLQNGIKGVKLDVTKGVLYSCNCDNFMHYTWCYHVHADAVARGIITTYPTNMQPAPTEGSRGRGRPSFAVKGGALGKK